MCGIAGSINCRLTNEDIDLISHRGPDHKALIHTNFGENEISLGHTRLAILDISEAGNQPMFTSCGNYGIVFNGEIYNHAELRKKLGDISFRGHSDTETILYYLRKYGIDSVNDFNGIFAFAYLDKLTQKIYLVRDHFGVKPLYYYYDGSRLIFGSEIKVIKDHPIYTKDIDIDALNVFLTLRYSPAPQTLFKNIKKLEAATYLEYDKRNNITTTRYWTKKQQINHHITEQEALLEYKRLLQQAVKRQLLSDVPVGLLLSGGVDSALLGLLMSQNSSRRIKTFTVGFQGKGNYNEVADARESSQLINSEHYDIFMDRDQYMDYFYQSFNYTEEPIAEPTIPALFYVSKLASNHVKVVLSGQGADEPMAGYKRYRGEKIISDYKNILSKLPLSLVSKVFPSNSTLERGIYSLQFKEDLDRFLGIYTLFTPELKNNLYSDEMQLLTKNNIKSLFLHHYNQADPTGGSLSKLLFLDTRSMLPDNLLLFNDKMTMANSIENRVPYLDIDFINFIETLPIDLKLRGAKAKYIHRKAAEDWLPNSIINRKKRGFETPVGEWFKRELADSLLELVDDSNSFSRQYFKPSFIKRMIELHRSRKKDYQTHLFIILSLELWYKKYYNSTNGVRAHSFKSVDFV